MEGRKYNWSFAELCDRLSIVVMKIAYSDSKEMISAFLEERNSILADIDLFIKEGVEMDGEMVYLIQGLQFINTKIWHNESEQRGESAETTEQGWKQKYEKLLQSHQWNADRAICKKAIQEKIGGRVDYKLNYIKGAIDLKL